LASELDCLNSSPPKAKRIFFAHVLGAETVESKIAVFQTWPVLLIFRSSRRRAIRFFMRQCGEGQKELFSMKLFQEIDSMFFSI
jgi:hypothetical protein